jgi:site-specific recombinase XerD
MTALAPTLQAFSPDRLAELHASGETIRAYRDTWRLMLGFPGARTGKRPSALDIDSDMVAAFLDHLEHDRHNSARTRNARLSATHSVFRFAALRHPEHAATIGRVLAMPSKCYERH